MALRGRRHFDFEREKEAWERTRYLTARVILLLGGTGAKDIRRICPMPWDEPVRVVFSDKDNRVQDFLEKARKRDVARFIEQQKSLIGAKESGRNDGKAHGRP